MNPPDGITKWIITDENGTIYEFGATQTTEDIPIVNGESRPSDIQEFISSWFLTKIRSPLGDDEIEFEYESKTPTWIEHFGRTYHEDFILSGGC